MGVGYVIARERQEETRTRLKQEEHPPHGKVHYPPIPQLWMLKNSVWHPARREKDPFPQILNDHKVTLVSAQTAWVLFKKLLLV